MNRQACYIFDRTASYQVRLWSNAYPSPIQTEEKKLIPSKSHFTVIFWMRKFVNEWVGWAHLLYLHTETSTLIFRLTYVYTYSTALLLKNKSFTNRLQWLVKYKADIIAFQVQVLSITTTSQLKYQASYAVPS